MCFVWDCKNQPVAWYSVTLDGGITTHQYRFCRPCVDEFKATLNSAYEWISIEKEN